MINIKIKNCFRLFLIIIIISLVTLPVTVSADGFYTYGYTKDKKAVEAPPAVDASYIIMGSTIGTSDFNSPQDLIVSENGTVYVADTGNNRVVVIGSDGKIKNEILKFLNPDGGEETFNSPKGIFVTDNENIYICDTNNSRIVQLNNKDELIQEIVFSGSDTMSRDFIFKPVKVSVDRSGRIFVVSEGFNNGLLEFTSSGNFIQYMGAAKVALTPSQLFWRTFSTSAQRSKTSSSVSTEYSNVEIDDQGFLMVTTSAYEYWQYKANKLQALRKLNAKGIDVLPRVDDPSGDLEYPDEKSSRASYKGPSTFVDVCTLPYGNYAVLDQKRGRVFAYNADGELMYSFGGIGDFNGGLSVATAVDYNDDKFYIIDSQKKQINVYYLTNYGKLFNQVSKAQQEIDYNTEGVLWNKIINENSNCKLAMRGLGIAAYRKKDMNTAQNYFKLAGDRENYSKAFIFSRREWIEKNAVLLIISVLFIGAAIVFAKKLWKKQALKSGKNGYIASLDYANYIAFHPMRGFWELKREGRGSLKAAVTFLSACCIVRIVSQLITGFLFNTKDIQKYNPLVDLGLILILMLVWCVSQWCVTVLMDGEGKLKEIFIASCYSLTPYIWFSVIAIAASRVLSLDEAEFHMVLLTVGVIYSVFLMIMSIMATHDFSMRKTLIVLLIILVVILLIAFIAMLLLSLSQKMISFVSDLYNEIALRI